MMKSMKSALRTDGSQCGSFQPSIPPLRCIRAVAQGFRVLVPSPTDPRPRYWIARSNVYAKQLRQESYKSGRSPDTNSD